MSNYTVKVVELNAAADQTLLGVRLGRLCISQDISVNHVAKYLNVTKATVYKWFAGKADISKHLRDRADSYYRSFPPLGPRL